MKQGIPKSMQDLLARQTAADEHPSADLLNGYMEQSLTASERTQVTKHLAACGECREIVFLASGVQEEEAVPAVAAAMPAQRATSRRTRRPAEVKLGLVEVGGAGSCCNRGCRRRAYRSESSSGARPSQERYTRTELPRAIHSDDQSRERAKPRTARSACRQSKPCGAS